MSHPATYLVVRDNLVAGELSGAMRLAFERKRRLDILPAQLDFPEMLACMEYLNFIRGASGMPTELALRRVTSALMSNRLGAPGDGPRPTTQNNKQNNGRDS